MLFRKLNQIIPLESLRHVKRVRKERLDGGFFLSSNLYIRIVILIVEYAISHILVFWLSSGSINLSAILCLAGENDCQLDIIPQEVVDLIDSYKLKTFITKVSYFIYTVQLFSMG